MPHIYDIVSVATLKIFKYFILIIKPEEVNPKIGRTILTIDIAERGVKVSNIGTATPQAQLLAWAYSEMYATDLVRTNNLSQNDIARWNELVIFNAQNGIDHPYTRACNDILHSVEQNMINNLEKEKDKDVA